MMNLTTDDLTDARDRLTLAAKDLEGGLAKVRDYYRRGMLTDADFADRVAFLYGRHALALDDFSRARRARL